MSTPKEASKSLNIPSSTLRRWSNEFSEYLSSHKEGKHRDYTISDISTLRKIRDLRDEGMRYSDIHKKLNIIEEAPNKNFALELINDYTEALLDTQALLQALSHKIKKQDNRLEELEEWITLPPLKRLFTKPPKRKDQE